jgi:hypothetical protein
MQGYILFHRRETLTSSTDSNFSGVSSHTLKITGMPGTSSFVFWRINTNPEHSGKR